MSNLTEARRDEARPVEATARPAAVVIRMGRDDAQLVVRKDAGSAETVRVGHSLSYGATLGDLFATAVLLTRKYDCPLEVEDLWAQYGTERVEED